MGIIMQLENFTKEQLLRELQESRNRINTLEASLTESTHKVNTCRQSEERFRSLFLQAPLSYQSLDEKGFVIEVNQTWLDTLGYFREEVLARWFGDFVAPDYRGHFTKNFSCFKETGEIGGIEFGMVRKDGSTIIVSLNGKISHDEYGNFKQTHCILQDITCRKQMEADLRQSEERLRLAVEATELGTWDYNLLTGDMIWSDRCKAILGLPPGSVVSYEILLSCIHPEDRERRHQATQQSLEPSGPGEYHTEYRVLWTDGSVHWVEAKGQTFFDTLNGKRRATRMIGTVLDITERKQAEDALGEQRLIQKLILEQSLAGYWDWRIKDGTEYMSPTFKRMFGYEDHELANTPETWQTLIFPEDLPGVLEVFRRHVESRGKIPYYNEVRYRHKNGSTVWVICTGQVIKWDEQGQPVRMIGCHVDITERKRTEEQLHKQVARGNLLLALYEKAAEFTDKQLYDYVLEKAVHLTDSAIGFFHRVSDDQKNIILTTWNSEALRNCTATYATHYPVEQAGNWVDCVRFKHPVIYNDFPNSPNRKGLPEGHVPVRRFMSIPVIDEDKVRIIFGVGNKAEQYEEHDVVQIQLVANELHKIIKQRRSDEAMRKSNQRLDLLAETASRLLSSDPLQEVVDSLCRKVLAFLDCDAYFNYLVDDDQKRLHLNACGGIPEEDVQKMEWLDYGVGLCGCSARDGCRLVVDDVQGTHDQYTELVKPFGIQAYACHPLISKGHVLGTLSFCTRKRTRFADDELSIMKAVADQVAIAMERFGTEEKLHQANVELGKRVAERTFELAETVTALQKEIAEREKTAEALRKSEERYALAVEGASDGIWERDFAAGKTYFSPRWKSILGYEDHEIPNERDEWWKRIHPDDYENVRMHLADYLEGRSPAYRIEYRMLHKDGCYRWILAKGACVYDSQGKPSRMAGSHTDITEIKHAEEQLRKNEELLRIILETLPVGVVVFDKNGKKILENQMRKKIWCVGDEAGVALEEYKGWFTDSGEQIKKEEWPVSKAFNEGITESKIVEIECFDGTKKTIINSGAPLIIGGRIVAGIGVVEDITEQKRLEQQLLQAQKMESIGLLAGGVAHEFNNLLTAISGCCEELQEAVDNSDEDLQSNIQMIQSAAKEAADLTRSLLAFGRQQVMRAKPVSINDLIADAGKLLLRTLEENIHFSLDLCSEKLTVMADSGQIKQVIVNLAINARDAMPSGGNLTIRTCRTMLDEEAARQYDLEKPGAYAVVSVYDTGAGMDGKTIEKIFEPFFTTKEIGKGTGLGLSIIYGIIKQHNGSIRVESKPGEGTTFTIYLPGIEAEITKEKPQRIVLPSGGRETILVVEDDDFVRHFLEKTLCREGYEVITAGDGEEAVGKFQGHQRTISLIISDMMMPKKSGPEMYDEIIRIKPGTRMLFISGYSADMIEKNGILGENVDFIGKPFAKKDLLAKTKDILGRKPGETKGDNLRGK
jgi:two-component system cell cycle sensor histidine kinase/response regulator CckA